MIARHTVGGLGVAFAQQAADLQIALGPPQVGALGCIDLLGEQDARGFVLPRPAIGADRIENHA